MLRMGKNQKPDQADPGTGPGRQANVHTSYSPERTPGGTGYSATSQPHPGGEASTARTQMDSSSSASRAVTESEALAREIREGNLSGFVGNGTTLTGEATFKSTLRVDGHLSGRVSSDGGTLIVGHGGRVDANIEVAVAMIHGTVNGDIIARQRLELGRAAKVNGNIQTPSLVIEEGGIFEGSCRMSKAAAAEPNGSSSRDIFAEHSDASPVVEPGGEAAGAAGSAEAATT